MKPTIVIAGATGFIGRWFIDHYAAKYRIIALSRKSAVRHSVVWRKVDMYSVSSTINALEGADYALYLVHSMRPSTRLNQGAFDDTDLLLADNFARAADTVGIKQIIFIGGILPKDKRKFSRHIRSRHEEEQTLSARTPALTTLRAGIIVGPGGSSFEIIENWSTDCLQYVRDWSDSRRQLFYIVGGILAKRTDYGWLEFRSILGDQYIIGAIHEFVPRLPWFIYVNTQALLHLWVMRRFGRHLSRAIRV